MMRRVARGIVARALTVATAAAAPAVAVSARFASATPKAPAATSTVAAPAVKVNAAAKPGKATDAFAAKLGSRVVSRHQAGDHASVIIDSQMFAWVVMDRAGSSANALGDEFGASLMAAMHKAAELVQAKQARVIILTSAKDTFCVGADIDQLYPTVDQSFAVRVSQEGQQMLQQMADLKIPVVAAINGLALGGGCELALACHHRVMASTAQMGLPECLLGLLPGAGGTVRLPQLIGLQNALGWILKSSSNRAETCKKQGAVDAVVQSEDRFVGENRFIEGVRAWAGKLVDKPLRPAKGKKKSLLNKFIEDTAIGHKLVVWQSLKALNKQTKGKFLGHYAALESTIHAAKVGATADAYAFEAKKFGEMLVTPEAKNQIALYYLENLTKNIEKKTGILKKNVWDVKNVGVIGAGVMGSGIAHLFVNKKYNVTLKDVDQARVDAGVKLIQGEFDKVVKRKRATPEDIKKKMSLLHAGTNDTIFNETDVIIEAAVEVMDIKKKIVQGLEEKKVLDGKKIFATNTSSLSVTDLQSVSKFPEKVVGMHFFNPVSKMPLVEVIVGDKTSKETAAAIYNLALKTGKKPIIVKDAPGFVVNRVLGVYMAEAGRLVEDGADPIKVEQAILNFGLPMGPFGLLDMVGLDVACHVGPVLEKGLKSKRFSTHPKIHEMMQHGYLGKKVRKGFYRYDEKGKELGIDATVVAKYLTTSPDSTFPAADIVDRCILLMVNEAAMILGEGVAATAEDVDTGMVWGTGFAPFRGGLLQYADHRGIQAIVDRLTQLKDKHKDDRFEPAPLLKEMAAKKTRFFPNRPFVPYVERVGFPTVNV